jgi:2,3-bisphosphoglycerate-independent phosphoglycerate mutase
VKYVVLIIDGASGWPAAALGGLTSLEAAWTPNLDRLAQEGTVGTAANVPGGMEASSAVACMSVLGFDPALYYAGRGPIEAMAMGIKLEPDQVAMRCNLVTVIEGRLVSYSAGNISSEESHELIAALRERLPGIARNGASDERLELYPGVGFRHILTVLDGVDLLSTTFAAPHDITDRPVAAHAPAGPGAALVSELMEASKEILVGHPVNQKRIARCQLPATQIWLFWPGMRLGHMPSFAESYGGRRAVLTSAVDLLRGLALQTGVDYLAIPGVTDGGDNDYHAQMADALKALDEYDVVFVHVEAPDEASHAGDVAGKVRSIEDVDALMVPQVIALRERLAAGAAAASAGGGGKGAGEGEGVRLLVLPDHPTPLELKTHVAEPVPFVMWGSGCAANGAQAYSETEARATGFAVTPGHRLMSLFLEETH